MKHILLFAALVAGSAGAAGAQTLDATARPAATADSTRRLSFTLGLTLGPTLSSFLGSDATTGQSVQYRPGFHGGVMADVHLGNDWAFHPEVLYAEKGTSYDIDQHVPDLRLSYLDVPLLARRYFESKTGTKSLFVEAGPRVSALLTARQSDTKADRKSSFRPVDAGFVLGVGYRTDNGIAIGLRYDVSVINTYKTIPTEASFGRGNYQPNNNNEAYFLSVSFPILGQ